LRPTQAPSTSNPTSHPIGSSIESQSANTSCESNLFHPSEDYTKCTNRYENLISFIEWHSFIYLILSFCVISFSSLDYPDEWNYSHVKSTYLSSRDNCCQTFFVAWNVECTVEDVCELEQSTGSPDAAPCFTALWHPTENYSQCSNRFGYKDQWNSPALKEHYLFKSLDDCCYNFFIVWGEECVVDDMCKRI
jgi:hypothetical protein